MSRPARITLRILAGLAALVIVLLIAAIFVIRTQWFRGYVRDKIVAYVESATGGTATIGSFSFDWTHLHAHVSDFIIHGAEGPGKAPLFQAKSIDLTLRLLPSLSHTLELESLAVNQPQVDLIVYPDGHTNVPSPKTKPTSNNTVLENVVDLAIGRFTIQNGSITFADRKANFNAQGENLVTQLSFNTVGQTYDGQISMKPLYVQYDGNQRLDLNVQLPVHFERDKVQIANAKITTPESEIVVNGSMQHLVEPQTSAHIQARIALDEVRRVAGPSVPLDLRRKDIPKELTADLAFSMDKDHIQISTARMNLGQSDLEASGMLKDPSGNGSVKFNGKLVLAQIGHLLDLSVQPSGVVQLAGSSKLVGASGYSVTGNIEAKNLSFKEGANEYKNINLESAISANENAIQLNGIKLSALGGEFTGNASLADMRELRLAGNLHNFDIRQLARTLSNQAVAYDGIISGPIDARDDLKAKGTTGIVANAHLAIAPGPSGVPVSGRLNVDYNGATGAVNAGNSYIALPSSRLDLSGSLNHQIQVKLVSHNLNDFLPALAMTSKNPPAELPVQLRGGGSAVVTGTVSGDLNSPKIAGHVALTNFSVDNRPFDRLAADINASSSGASVQNATLSRGTLQAQFAANVGLHQWKPESYEPVGATARIENADLADVLALAGQTSPDFSGALNANAQISGTIGNPRGSASLSVANGTAYDYRFDQLTANVNLSDQLVTISNAQLSAGTAHVNFSGTFQHPRDSFETGHVQLQLASNSMGLDQFRQSGKPRSNLGGALQIDANAAGDLAQVKGQEDFRLASVNANINARSLQYEGQNYGDFTAAAHTAGSNIDYRINSDFAGSTIRATGQTRLTPDYPTTASLNVTGLPIEKVLTIAGRKDLQFSGNLSANAQLAGTISNPNATANFTIANANIYEHLDSVQGQIVYAKQNVEIPSLRIASGTARMELAGSFTHPPNDFNVGDVKFNLKTNAVQLSQFKKLQDLKPGLAGIVEIDANGAATLQNGAGKPPVLLTNLNANASAKGIQVNKQPFGDATLTAATSGSDLTFKLNSNFAHSKIQGDGRLQLTGDYPIQAQVNFANVTYAGLRSWMGQAEGGALTQAQVDGVAEGSATISGPVLKPEELTASLRIPKLVVTATPRGQLALSGTKVTVQNQGPIVATLSRSTVKIESAHIVGPDTDINVSGTATLQPKQDLNVNVKTNTNLSLIQSFNHDIYSSGSIMLQASVRGTLDDPRVNGELRLQNAAFNMIDAPNGISNANGLIVFNGKTASIQSLTAESGGGKISITGNAGYATGVATYRLVATADSVRVRYPESISTVASANLTLTGSSDRGMLGGTVTILRIQFNPHSDFGSILSSSSPPIQSPPSPNSFLSAIRLQVSVRTAPGVQFQTALAQNIEAIADLRVRGTLDEPSVLGRITITQGQLVFFGTKYTVNQGSIAFYDPLKIEPVLDVDLETTVQGVNITLTVSGTPDNLTLTHRSDPPLPFNQVLALLAAGKTPQDPTIAAREPVPPPQSLEQMGESAILQQVVANPVSSRLSRVFGISELKIAPAFVTGSVLPQARLTLSQQISNNINFTYITDLSNSNQQIFQIDWAITPQWSAVATRDENGLFGIDFYYKKKFK